MKDEIKFPVYSSAPGRVDLSGGGADMFEGPTLSAAVDLRAYSYIDKDRPGKKSELIKSVRNRFNVPPELGINVHTEIPKESGLGGSAAVTVSAIHALNRLSKSWFKQI